jgi:hypothetical protein
MSGPTHTVPAEDFVLPVPNTHGEETENLRKSTDSLSSQRPAERKNHPSRKLFGGVWRHTIGVMFLLATVIMWTISNFLASVSFTDFPRRRAVLIRLDSDDIRRRRVLQAILRYLRQLLILLYTALTIFCKKLMGQSRVYWRSYSPTESVDQLCANH